jgi:hypothetical protein
VKNNKNGRAGRGRAAKGLVRSKSSLFDRAMQRASSALSRDWPADTFLSTPLKIAVDRMVRDAKRIVAAKPAARELYYLGHRLHLRSFHGWLLILDSRHRPLVGPVRLIGAVARPKPVLVQQ